jgi:hypothetical protein
MSFGFSIGDILLCTQIAHRLFSSVTRGRKKSPRDLKELGDTLFGLCSALDLLQINHKSIVDNASSMLNIVVAHMSQHLGYMIESCQGTLKDLDSATVKHREAGEDLPCTLAQSQHVIVRVP